MKSLHTQPVTQKKALHENYVKGTGAKPFSAKKTRERSIPQAPVLHQRIKSGNRSARQYNLSPDLDLIQGS